MIHSVTAQFFQSWKVLNVKFENGVTLVTGQNLDDNTAEGSGKSAIFNAITWALWGKLPKDTNIDDVVTIGSNETTLVAVQLDDGTEIIRSRNPNDLFVTNSKNMVGHNQVRGKDMKESQNIINELIGMSFETFCQSIYFPQNYEKKFITSNEAEKAKILSEIQDLTIFDRAAKKANENAKKEFSELDRVKMELSSKEQIQTSLQTQLKTLEDLESKFTKQKEFDIIEMNNRIATTQKDIAELQTAMLSTGSNEDMKEKQRTRSKFQAELQSISNKIYGINQLRNQAGSKDCPTCKRPLENHQHIEIPDDSEFIAAQKIINTDIITITKEIEDIQEKKIKFDNLVMQMGFKQNDLKRSIRELDKLQKSTNDYEDKIYLILEQLNALAGGIDALRSKQLELKDSFTQYTFLCVGFKEIKSHVFQGLLNDLNIKSNYYVREFFDIPCSIKFTNISDEGELSKIQTKVTLNNHEYTLGLLSGGQMRRVQLAVDFAISEIIAARSSKKINMRILDEPFKDLSEEKQAKILEFLKKMPGKTLIIEHSPIIKSFVDRELRIELKNGISMLTCES